jgi:formiminotetrahydrofolate cyclodeaminase
MRAWLRAWRRLRRFFRIGRGAGAGGAGAGSEGDAMLSTTGFDELTRRLAAATPTPGGGSASAAAGALSAALLTMVTDLTLGREAHRAHEAAVGAIRQRAEGLRKDLLALVDRDAEAYDGVVRALRLPKGSEAERRDRSEALARATLYATETPLAIADACAALLAMAIDLAYKGNPNAVSDVGVAALLAYSGLRGGILNVRANLKGIKDEAAAARARERVRRLEVEAEKRREEALGAVFSRLNGR